MKVLVACEFSGLVRDAFRARGCDAWSCDLIPTERPGPHIQDDVLSAIAGEPVLCSDDTCRAFEAWDLMLAFPPCTHLVVSGARWFREKRKDGRQQRAVEFFLALADAPIPRIAIENPIGIMSSIYRKPDQIIQPWQFGHGETKATCLWLKGLPPLRPAKIVPGREPRVHRMPPGPDRGKERSRTYLGVAQAMADQWSKIEVAA